MILDTLLPQNKGRTAVRHYKQRQPGHMIPEQPYYAHDLVNGLWWRYAPAAKRACVSLRAPTAHFGFHDTRLRAQASRADAAPGPQARAGAQN